MKKLGMKISGVVGKASETEYRASELEGVDRVKEDNETPHYKAI